MLKLSNETKIGILSIVAIALGIWGFKFLKGINMLTPARTYFVRYDRVDQLLPSAPVTISGFQVGTVKRMYIDPDDDRSIIAELNINRGVDIPKKAVANIISVSIMGGKAVSLDFDQPCTGDDCAQNGAWLTGKSKNFLQSMIGSPEALDPYTEKLKTGLTSVYDSIADPNDPKGFGRTLVKLDQTLLNMVQMTNKLNKMLDASSSGIARTTNNVAGITQGLNDNQKYLISTLANLDSITNQLKNAGLSSMARTAMDSVTMSLSSLRRTLSAAEGSLHQVDSLAQKLNNGDGVASKLLTDPELYENIVRTSRHLQLLMQDLRLNPKRYTTVKLKVFGKNKTKDYKLPVDDPAYYQMLDSMERAYSRRIENQRKN